MEKRILVILVSLISVLSATALFGEIYNADTFARLDNTRIRIEGPVSSQLIASGNYSIDLPPGNYTIIASYFRGGKLDLYTEEKISISDRAVRFDLVLLPYALQNFIPNDSNGNETTISSVPIGTTVLIPSLTLPFEILFIVLIIVIALIIYFVSRNRVRKPKEQDETRAVPNLVPKKTESIEKINELAGTKNEESYYLDAESRKLLEIIKSQGGRMLQKELRDILKLSESAMSLMLSELEVVGYIKRFKRGRENLVKLVKEPDS